MFKEQNMDVKGSNVGKNPLHLKIKGLEEGKIQSQTAIAENKKSIEETEKEIERLRILEKRFQRLQAVKYWENIGDTEKISQLANKVNVKDFLESLQDCIDIHLSFSSENMNMGQLSVWQMLFLLYGSLDELGQKKQPPAGDPGAVDPEKIENSFDPNKKFM